MDRTTSTPLMTMGNAPMCSNRTRRAVRRSSKPSRTCVHFEVERLESRFAMDGFGLSWEAAMPVPVSADTGVMAIGESSAMQASVADVALRAVALPAVPGDTQVAPPESTAVLFMMLAGERTDAASTSVRPVAPDIPKGWDGASPPLPGWTWRGTGPVGSNEGGWVPPKGSPRDGESIHKDTTPHDIGDHVDWTDRPIWPKPQDLIPGYYKGAPSMDFT